MASHELKGSRKRNWTFIVYPESAPKDWIRQITSMGLRGAISPCHNRDVNPSGEPKKPHYHVVLTYSGAVTENAAQAVSDAFSGVKVLPVKDLRAMMRYLCHLDNPEKAQYDVNEVTTMGGVDYLEITKSAADVDVALGEMLDFCEKNDISSFYRLSLYARKNRPDWFRVLTTQRTVFLVNYLKSRRYERMEEEATGNFSDLTLQRLLLKASRSGDSAKREGDPRA